MGELNLRLLAVVHNLNARQVFVLLLEALGLSVLPPKIADPRHELILLGGQPFGVVNERILYLIVERRDLIL